MIAHLDRVEREAAEKTRLEHQQSRPSVVGSTLLGPANPGTGSVAGSDGKLQPPVSSGAATVSSKRTDSGRSWCHRASSPLPPLQSGLSCRVVVVEANADGSHIDRQRYSESPVATDQDLTTVVGTNCSSTGSTVPVAARSSVLIRRFSPSPSAHDRLDGYSVGGSVTSDSPWVPTAVGRVRSPGRVQSFAGRPSSKTLQSLTAVPREEAKKLLQPTHLEVHRTGSWSPPSSIEVPIGIPMNVAHRGDFSTKDTHGGRVEGVDTSTV